MPSLPFRIDGLHPRAWNTYSFRTRWQLRAEADAVYEVLADVGGYRHWWPQVRAGIETEVGAGDLLISSKLPYDLRLHLRQRRRDPQARVLEAQVTGDLEGTATWRIEALPASPAQGEDRASVDREAPPRCAAYFTEDVEARSALLRRLAPLARPAFIANHTAMMRDGQRGLSRFLAGRS